MSIEAMIHKPQEIFRPFVRSLLEGGEPMGSSLFQFYDRVIAEAVGASRKELNTVSKNEVKVLQKQPDSSTALLFKLCAIVQEEIDARCAQSGIPMMYAVKRGAPYALLETFVVQLSRTDREMPKGSKTLVDAFFADKNWRLFLSMYLCCQKSDLRWVREGTSTNLYKRLNDSLDGFLKGSKSVVTRVFTVEELGLLLWEINMFYTARERFPESAAANPGRSWCRDLILRSRTPRELTDGTQLIDSFYYQAYMRGYVRPEPELAAAAENAVARLAGACGINELHAMTMGLPPSFRTAANIPVVLRQAFGEKLESLMERYKYNPSGALKELTVPVFMDILRWYMPFEKEEEIMRFFWRVVFSIDEQNARCDAVREACRRLRDMNAEGPDVQFQFIYPYSDKLKQNLLFRAQLAMNYQIKNCINTLFSVSGWRMPQLKNEEQVAAQRYILEYAEYLAQGPSGIVRLYMEESMGVWLGSVEDLLSLASAGTAPDVRGAMMDRLKKAGLVGPDNRFSNLTQYKHRDAFSQKIADCVSPVVVDKAILLRLQDYIKGRRYHDFIGRYTREETCRDPGSIEMVRHFVGEGARMSLAQDSALGISMMKDLVDHYHMQASWDEGPGGMLFGRMPFGVPKAVMDIITAEPAFSNIAQYAAMPWTVRDERTQTAVARFKALCAQADASTLCAVEFAGGDNSFLKGLLSMRPERVRAMLAPYWSGGAQGLERFARVEGIDYDPEHFTPWTHKQIPQDHYACADACSTGLDDESVDAVFINMLYPAHYGTHEESILSGMVEEACRVLKPGGVLILTGENKMLIAAVYEVFERTQGLRIGKTERDLIESLDILRRGVASIGMPLPSVRQFLASSAIKGLTLEAVAEVCEKLDQLGLLTHNEGCLDPAFSSSGSFLSWLRARPYAADQVVMAQIVTALAQAPYYIQSIHGIRTSPRICIAYKVDEQAHALQSSA